MKTRLGFISNSSSTSFIIRNTSSIQRDLVDFVKENPQLIEQYVKKYQKNCEPYTQIQLTESAFFNNIIFESNETKICTFGDEDGRL